VIDGFQVLESCLTFYLRTRTPNTERGQARAKALALEEELRTARELIEENGGLYDVG
jgi:hypothetical protein